jgi:hypothetical protein
MRSLILGLMALACAGCGSDLRALVKQVLPLNGATAVDLTVRPQITLIDGAAIDLLPSEARKVVLYDVTAGAKKTVAGSVVAEGATITYEPEEALPLDHQFLLEIKKEGCDPAGSCSPTITGEEIEDIDGSEWPEEPISWPLKLGFSTGSRPRVRAAYLDDRRVVVRFSQPMNPVASEKAIQIEDMAGKSLTFGVPVWIDEQSVQVVLEDPLEVAAIYTLRVKRDAIGQDGTLLDGDDDGRPGEPDDNFSAKFTGSQRIIMSRLGSP